MHPSCEILLLNCCYMKGFPIYYVLMRVSHLVLVQVHKKQPHSCTSLPSAEDKRVVQHEETSTLTENRSSPLRLNKG